MELPQINVSKPTIEKLYEDSCCIVFFKPSGLLVIPTNKNEKRTLVSIVNELFGNNQKLFPAHRLDRDTSGVILFAKGKANQQKLMQAFKEKKVKKSYIAFVHGKVKPPAGNISIPIKDYFQQKFQRNIPAQGALTLYKTLELRKDFSIIEVNPITGRTNQIRIHFAKINHPLVGEDRYAFRKDFKLKFKRTALHAKSLSWPQIGTNKMLTIEAKLPKDMSNFLEKNK